MVCGILLLTCGCSILGKWNPWIIMSFKSIAVFCETDNISWNILTFRPNVKYLGIFYGILSVSHNIVMDLNNVVI